MSDERDDIDDAPEGFRLKPLSGAEVPEEADYEDAPKLSDAPASKSTPIADAYVMSDAEVSEVKAGRERHRRKAQARVSGKSFLKILALLVVIVGVIIAVVALGNSGATTGSTTPTTPTPLTKQAPVAKAPHKRGKKSGKKPGNKAGKNEKDTRKRHKKLPQVVAVPVHKARHKHPVAGAHTPPSTSPDNRTIDGLQAQESGHSDRLVAKAEKILEAKKYPSSYRKHPQQLKAYMEKELDYPVSLANVTDKTGVLGMQVLLPIGKVLLTHLQSGDLAPQITWVKLWKPDLTP